MNDKSAANLDVTKIVDDPSGGGQGGGTLTPRGRGSKTGATSTVPNTRTSGSCASKAAAPALIATPSDADAVVSNSTPFPGTATAATTTVTSGGQKRPYRAISDNPNSGHPADDDDDDENAGYMDQDAMPTGRRKRKQARFPAAEKTALVVGYNVGAPTTSFCGMATSGDITHADGGKKKNIRGLNGHRALSLLSTSTDTATSSRSLILPPIMSMIAKLKLPSTLVTCRLVVLSPCTQARTRV